MDFLGVGPLELILVIILALVVVGPRDLAKLGRDAGHFLNRMYRSPTWRTMNEASRELRNLPNRLAREAELDTLKRDLEQTGQTLKDDVHSAGDGMKAWAPAALPTPPPPRRSELAPPAAGEITSADTEAEAPSPPSTPPVESPFAEG
jgi:sec-independent protein translocase protein TatB